MQITYSPDGGDSLVFTYKARLLKASQAEILEKRTGWTLEQFDAKVKQGSTLARKALLWLFMIGKHPSLKFEDFDFTVGDVEVQLDKSELAELLEGAEKMPLEDESLRPLYIAEVRRQLEDAPDDPKAQEKSNA